MNETTMPFEDRRRRDEECRPPLPSDEADKEGDQYPVRPVEAGSDDLAMTEHACGPARESRGSSRICPFSPMKESEGAWTSRQRKERDHSSSLADSLLDGRSGSGEFLDRSRLGYRLRSNAKKLN